VTPRGICNLTFVQTDPAHEVCRLREQWSEATVREAPGATEGVVEQVFGGSWTAGPIPVLLKGTNFQINVWKALLKIPEGAVASYEDLAEIAAVPGAQRAVGNAVGANPISYLIPCHRIIRKTGEFGNYGGGPARKKAMLIWESARHHAVAV
jgi:AraC family transcriptional regulator of adaptative response/methylated-DNA-[protein]-cysteine methyltransferase